MKMQRHTFCFLSFVLLGLPLFAVAQQHNGSRIETFAKSFWREYKSGLDRCVYKSKLLKDEGLPCYVVVRTDETGIDTIPGFMLVTDNDDSPTILAFDEKARFTTQNLPPHIKSWIQGYERLNSTSSSDKEELRKWMKASQTDMDDVSPLLGAKEWGQDNPYNLLCPTIDGKHCPTGCVATALAQIMSYHRWPLKGTGSISYRTSTNWLPVKFDFSNTVFEWDKLLDSYIPVEDIITQDDSVVIDNNYYLNSITVDNNSVASSKCYVNVSGLTVMGASSFEGEIVLMATDGEGQCATRVSSATSIKTRSSGRILNNKSFLLYIPDTLPDGEYRVYCAVRSTGTNEWSLSNSRSKDNYITLIKEKDIFSIGNITYPCCLSTENIMPVSTLMQAVGAAVEMDYNLSGSGSYDAKTLDGLLTYLCYDSDMFFAYPESYTDEQWHEILQRELSEGRPVYYTGQGTSGGHAFVIDGFKKGADGITRYHVNWGWDGLCNGYYLLNMLRPSSAGTGGSSGSNYSNHPSMLIGMMPEDGVSHLKMTCSGMELLAEEYRAGGFFPARIRSLSLKTSNVFEGKLQLVLQDEHGGQAPMVVYEEETTITSKRGLKDYLISAQIPTNVPTGHYTLKVVCTTSSGEEVELQCYGWPRLGIKGLDEWSGGPLTQPVQKLAIGGNIRTQTQGENALVILTVDSLVNPMPLYTNGQIAVAVCNEEGRMLAEPSTLSNVSVYGYNVRKNVSVSSHISRYIPDGNYELHVVYLPQNESLWTICDQILCKDNIWWASFKPISVNMTISGGTVAIQDMEVFQGADIPWTEGIMPTVISADTVNTLTDLLGRKVNTPRKGVYVQATGKTRKKIIK